jgi:hypothetical protein
MTPFAYKLSGVALGFAVIIFNKQLSDITGRWQKMAMGKSYHGWVNRIPFILAGCLLILVSVFS